MYYVPFKILLLHMDKSNNIDFALVLLYSLLSGMTAYVDAKQISILFNFMNEAFYDLRQLTTCLFLLSRDRT